MRFVKWALGAAGMFVVGFGVSAGAQGARTQEPDILSALLTEVRGLRQALEEMGTAGPRVQLALGRLQLQEQRVNTALRRLESIRDSISKTEREVAGQQGQLESFQKMFKPEKPGEENPMAAMMGGFKNMIEAGTLEVQRLQSEEAQLQQQIASEQGRWAEINKAMEDLERALGKRPAR
jgi:chromosome segregation ATPase